MASQGEPAGWDNVAAPRALGTYDDLYAALAAGHPVRSVLRLQGCNGDLLTDSPQVVGGDVDAMEAFQGGRFGPDVFLGHNFNLLERTSQGYVYQLYEATVFTNATVAVRVSAVNATTFQGIGASSLVCSLGPAAMSYYDLQARAVASS